MQGRYTEHVFAAVAAACTLMLAIFLWQAVRLQSLTDDEPLHLLAGYQALRYGQNTLNLEHPPLAKLLEALPVAVTGPPLAPPLQATKWSVLSRYVWADPQRMHASRIPTRTVALIALGLPLLLGCYLLGREAAGARAGVVLALAVGLSPCVLPFLPLNLTDAGEAAAFVLTLVACLRYLRRPTLGGAAWAGVAAGVGLATKFSGVLLGPVVVYAVALARRTPVARRAGHLAAAAIAALGIVHVTYAVANWDYQRSVGAVTIQRYCRGEATLDTDRMLERAERPLLALERFDPAAAQWLTGFLGVADQNRIGVYFCYAFGHISTHGFWWYFPVLLLVKTPISVLVATAAAAAGVILLRRRARNDGSARLTELDGRGVALLLFTAALYLALSMASTYNIGLRHLFPVLPVLFLPAAAAVARHRAWAAALLVCLAAEALALAPAWMAATNTWWLGAHNPTRLAFADSNLDFCQSFVILRQAARERGIERIHVVHPLAAPGEIVAAIPFADPMTPDSPVEPGWYAVSVIVEQFLPALATATSEQVRHLDALRTLGVRWQRLCEAIWRGEDHGYIAGTFHLYYVRGGADAVRRDAAGGAVRDRSAGAEAAGANR